MVNGTVTSNVQALRKNHNSEISPMPVKQNEIVHVQGVTENSTIEWIDMMGKVFAKSVVGKGGVVFVPQVNKGIYLIRYFDRNEVVIKRIVVE